METVELFKIIGKRVTKLPVVQQEEIIETMLSMVEATERMNRSSAIAICQNDQPWGEGFNLTKSVSSFALSNGHSGSMDVDLGGAVALTSSPSNLL